MLENILTAVSLGKSWHFFFILSYSCSFSQSFSPALTGPLVLLWEGALCELYEIPGQLHLFWSPSLVISAILQPGIPNSPLPPLPRPFAGSAGVSSRAVQSGVPARLSGVLPAAPHPWADKGWGCCGRKRVRIPRGKGEQALCIT